MIKIDRIEFLVQERSGRVRLGRVFHRGYCGEGSLTCLNNRGGLGPRNQPTETEWSRHLDDSLAHAAARFSDLQRADPGTVLIEYDEHRSKLDLVDSTLLAVFAVAGESAYRVRGYSRPKKIVA